VGAVIVQHHTPGGDIDSVRLCVSRGLRPGRRTLLVVDKYIYQNEEVSHIAFTFGV